MKKIIDVSKHQGKINYTKAAKKIDGVIIRAGYGLNTVDEQFYNNINGFQKECIPIGIYWFSYAVNANEARLEAAKCLETIKNHIITLPIYFDWEYDSDRYARQHGYNLTKEQITIMAREFCITIKAAGYKAGVYFNEDYRQTKIDVNQIEGVSTWYARYNESIQTPPYDLWQYTSKGSIDGINGNVDISYLINLSLLDTVPIIDTNPIMNPPEIKTIDQIVDEVIAGKWDNGLKRRNNLKAAGYNYVKIQTLVNKKLRQMKKNKV